MIGLGCLISLNTQQPYLVGTWLVRWLDVGSKPVNWMDGRPDDGRTFAKTKAKLQNSEGRRESAREPILRT